MLRHQLSKLATAGASSNKVAFGILRSNTRVPGEHVEDAPKDLETTGGKWRSVIDTVPMADRCVKDEGASKKNNSGLAKLRAASLARLKAKGFDVDTLWMASRLGDALGAIHSQTLDPCDQPVTSTTDFEFLCSYTWGAPSLREERSKGLPYTICVPGDAPRMVYHSLPQPFHAIKSDKAITYRDANLGRLKRGPWRPMFRALQIMRPGYKLDDVDIIINRNVLQSLLRFAKGQKSENFRLNLAMIGDTLLVTPHLRTAFEGRTELLGRLFERTFTKAASKEQARGTHHRAIRYKIGPLDCVVLFECDAQIDDAAFRALEKDGYSWKEPNAAIGGQALHDSVVQQRQHSTDRERARFKRLSQASFEKPELKPYASPFDVIHDGQGTPSSQTAELMASLGATSKKIVQMWLGRTPYFVLARQEANGVFANAFSSISVEPSWPRLLQFEKNNQESLRKLVPVIRLLKHYASTASNQSCAAVYTGRERTLRMYEYWSRHASDSCQGFQSYRGLRTTFWKAPGVLQVAEKAKVMSPTKTTKKTAFATPKRKKEKKKTASSTAPSRTSPKDRSIVQQQRARNAALYTVKEPPPSESELSLPHMPVVSATSNGKNKSMPQEAPEETTPEKREKREKRKKRKKKTASNTTPSPTSPRDLSSVW